MLSYNLLVRLFAFVFDVACMLDAIQVIQFSVFDYITLSAFAGTIKDPAGRATL